MGLAAGAVQDAAAQSPAITLSKTSVALTENSTTSYFVRLATQPSADVTVSISGASGPDLTLSTTSLTFTTTNYATDQRVRVGAPRDDNATGVTTTLTHSASGGGYDSVSADLPVTVTDTTRMRVNLVMPRQIREGTSTPIRAALPTPLDDAVSITVTAAPNGGRADEYTLSANRTLTIAAGETESTGEVTFTFLDDSIDSGTRYFSVTLTPDHARVDAYTESLVAVVDDDNTIPGLQLSRSTIFENGGQATLRGYISELTDGVVKLSVSLDPSDRATLSGSTLTFPPGAIYSTETLTITATDNAADEADQTLTISATVMEGRGVRNPESVSLTIRDDEDMAAELALVLTPKWVREGLTSTVTAVASAPLAAEATITVSASPTNQETRATDYVLSADRVLTIPAGGTTSTGTVTIEAVDDSLADSRQRQVNVSGTVTGGGLADPAGQWLGILEDDRFVTVELTATPATIVEGGTSTITVRALEPVPADVSVTVTESTGSDAVELSENTTLMIREGQTAGTGTVTLTAIQDTDADDEVVSVRMDPSSDSSFVRITGTPVFVIDDDSDTAEVWMSPVPPTVLEGGSSAITATLTKALSQDVTLTIGVDNMDPNHTARDEKYTMSANRTLTIAAGSTSSTGVVTLTSTNDEYYGPSWFRRVALKVDSVTGIEANRVLKHSDWHIVEDEDQPRVTLDVTPARISENGGQSSVTATLNTIVDAEVEVTVATAPVGTADTGDFSQTGTTLSFAARTKESTGTVTIAAVNDDVDGPDKNLVVTGTVREVGMEDSAIAWYPWAEGLTIRDDEDADLLLSKTSLNPAEGGSESFTVALSSEPTATVTVAVAGTSGTDLTLNMSSLTFTTSTWSTAQVVTVSADEDDDATDDTATLTLTASGGDYAGKTADVSVTVADDESVGLVLSKSSINPGEGSSESYTVALSSEPTTATVTVAITGTSGTDLTLNTSSLTFTTSNWGTAQTVTVSAGQDDDAADDTATLTHTASGGDYAGETEDVSVTVDDDESVGLDLSKSTLTPSEGGSESYTVKLSSEPTATVTVAITGTSGTDLSLNTSSLTFTTSSWGTVQTVTVSAGQDADATDDTATLRHTASGGDYAGETEDVSVTVADDESVGLDLSKSSVMPSEGGSESYTVALSSEPTATVTVAITGVSGTDLTLNASSLTFTTSDWGTAQTVTVSAGQDADATDDTATLRHTASGGDYADETEDVSVTVADDESVGLDLSKSSVTPSEGGSESYTVALSSAPTATVTVAITGTSGTDLTLNASSLTFTTSNWGTAQTVTVSAGQDDDATDDTATLRHTASGGDYAGETADVSVTVADDESVGLDVSKSSVTPSEGGSESYTVALSSEPTATVTVVITGTAGTDLSLNTSSLTFTTSTWGTVQTVTVSAGQDDDATDDTATLRHTASGGDYAGETEDVSVTVADDESVGLDVSKSSVNPSEGGSESYTVVLSSAPTATVTVVITGTAGTDLSLNTSSLTFTTSSWGTAQTVTVSAGQDDDATDDTATLRHTASGGDYAGETEDVSVTVADDESVGLDVSKSSVMPSEGGSESYTVALSSEPTATVTVAITGTAGTDLSLNTSSLTFTTSDWGTVQTVTVSAGQDDDATDDTATLRHTASGGDYAGETEDVSVTVADDESVGLDLSKSSVMPSEGGSESYTVKLSSEPTATVTVAITGTAGTDLSLNTSSLTFTTSSWGTVQTVTVSAGQDADATDDTATLRHTASGGDYAGETEDVLVTVADDESVGLKLSKSSVMPSEGGSESYTVVLSSEPTATVTVAITGASGTDLSLNTSSLTFTTSDWGTVQTVTVSAGQDDDATDDTATLRHTASGGDYAGETEDVSVTVADDESVGLKLSKSSVMPSEGGSESYTVVLSSEPTATVTVAIAGTSGTDLSLNTSSLTFTTSNWGTVQTVTVSAGQDDDAADDTATLRHTASGGDYAGRTAELPVTVADDESVGLKLSKSSVNPSEGGSESYTVVLSSEPTATVTVAIAGTSGTDLSLNTSSLTFTTSSWGTVQTVTVSAGQDDDAADDTATLTHTASGGDYAGETEDVSVTVADDESVGLDLSKSSVNPSEGGNESYTVVLSSEPTATVTVAITGVSGTDLTLNASSLTFTTSDWDTAQTVTVTAAQDDDAADDEATLTHTASGGDYAGETEDVLVTVADDESVGLELSKSSVNPSEGGSESYTVALSSEPTAQVTVAITGTADTDLTLNTSSLTFTTSDWGTAQTVTVTAGQDDDATDDTATLTHTASGGDYAGETEDVLVKVDDDESVGLELSKSSVNPSEGGSESYTVALSSEPTATVTVAITGTSDTDLTLNTSSLTFTTSDWGTAQTVTVSAGQDDDATDDTATLTHTASGGDYADKTAELPVTVDDDESVGIELSESSLNPAEGGDASYTVALSTEPTATVTVAITGTSGTDLTLSTSSLTFTTSDWGTAQTVTVSAGEDDDATDDTATLTHTASGGDYADKTAELPVTVDDDESVGIELSESSLHPAEGGDASYTVALSTEPTATVTVTVTGTTGTDLTLSTSSLTFTTSDWGTAQTVTVTAGQDDDATDDTATLTHTASGGDYAGRTAELPVTVDDDESASNELTLTVAPTSVAEDGGDTQVTVTGTLDGAPRGAETVVTVSVSGDTASADDFAAVSPFELTIAADSTEGTATFTLTPVDDELGEGDETVSVTGTTTVSDLTVEPATLTITDDDLATDGIALSVEPARVDEGAGATRVTVTATLDGAARQSATVVKVTVAENAERYAVAPALFDVEIPVGETTGTGSFELTPVDDNDDEPDQQVLVSGETNPMPVQPAMLTIADNDEPNAAPTFRSSRYTFDLPENRSGQETPVVLGTVEARDSDGDRLRYALAAGDRDRFTVSRRSGEVSYIGAGEDFETGPSEFALQVTTRDGEHEVRAQVRVRVVDVPEPPEAENDRAETPEDTPLVIDVLANDSDPDGDELRVASVSAPEHGTATVVSGGVRYEPDLNWFGEDRFSYRAADPGGLTSRAAVRVTVTPVNDPPEAVDDEAETLEDVPAVVDVLANDTDVDGDELRVVSVGPAAHGVTAVAEGGVRYASELNWYGTDRFVYTIADPEGLTASATVTMTVLPVNDPPEAVGVIPDQAVEEGGAPVTVDVLPYFTDVDGDVLTYAAVSSDETAVTVSVSGSTLTLSPVVTGTATVTVTAADVEGLTAEQRFGVAVGDQLVRGIITDMLAGFGRGHLSSVRMTVGRLLETGGGGAPRLMLAGQHLSPDAWRQMGVGGLPQSHELLFRAATLQQRRSATDLVGTSADPRLRGPGAAGMFGGGFGGAGGGGRAQWLQSTDVLLSFGDADDAAAPDGAGGGRWRVWGQGDRQSFQGAPSETSAYEGDLLSGYVGMDVRLGERLLAGVAVGRSAGGGGWQVGSSSGALGTELTVLHPYVRWGDQERAVWALAGIGRGTAENVRALVDRRGTSPLHLALGLLEGRQRVAATGGGLEVHLRGEASWARLRTGAGEETIDGLEAGVRRVRSGVEVTLPRRVPGGMTLAPFGAVSTRHDGGDGQTGVGLEVAGGMRLNAGRVRIEAQGRMLALHTATDYEERGMSVTATVGGRQYEPGLAASLRPRWGAPGHGAESLWQDHLQSYPEGTRRDDFGVDGRVGYGLRLPGERLLMPFGGYGRTRRAQRLQVGANLGLEGLLNGDLASPVQVEFMGERYARPGGADYRVSLYGIVNFGARPGRACNPAVAPCIGSEADAGRAMPRQARRADGI